MTAGGQFTQAQLDALTAAIAQGVLTVEYEGARTTYQSLPRMIELRNLMMTEIESQGRDIPRPLAFPSVYLKR